MNAETFKKKYPQINFYVGHETDKTVTKDSGVNVLYFTNKCNLACTYCYEDLPGRPPQILSKEDIKKSIDRVIEREDPNSQTLFVLFGGEATMEWDNVCYAMNYAYTKKKNVHFNLNTNGIRYLKQSFIEETKNNFFYKKNLLSIDVSFDEIQIDLLQNMKESLRKDWINRIIDVPVCELFCDMCDGCGERKEVKTYFTDEGNVTTYGNYENSPKFHDFKEKVII